MISFSPQHKPHTTAAVAVHPPPPPPPPPRRPPRRPSPPPHHRHHHHRHNPHKNIMTIKTIVNIRIIIYKMSLRAAYAYAKRSSMFRVSYSLFPEISPQYFSMVS